jgi:hypothetical protein
MVLETGELEPLTQGKTMELLNLASENELLGEGQQVPVLFTDNHVLHIQEHSALASDPLVRQDPQQFGIIAGHIQQHIEMLTNPAYQNYRQLTMQPSLPAQGQPQQQGAPMPQQGGMPAAPQGNPGEVIAPNTPMGAGQVQQMAQGVNMPNAPANALTGERAPLPGPV